jgi:hypothetical protein
MIHSRQSQHDGPPFDCARLVLRTDRDMTCQMSHSGIFDGTPKCTLSAWSQAEAMMEACKLWGHDEDDSLQQKEQTPCCGS